MSCAVQKCSAQANRDKKIATSMQYVLSCYGDPYIVDFEEIIEHPKVSIILPVYNKGWCVEAALRSLQRQTLKEIEIICVDDGSTDDSVEKIKKYQSHDTRIKLIENGRNRGLVYTRAYGMREATGEYIMFLDSDDMYATNDIVEVAYNKCIENDVDVVCFGSYVASEQMLGIMTPCYKIEYDKIYDDKNLFLVDFCGYCWDKFAKRECWLAALDAIPDNVIEKHINYAEDWLFNNALSLCMNRYVCINKYGYFYNLNAESICMQSKVYFPFMRGMKRANDIFTVYNTILASSPHMQDFILGHFGYLVSDNRIFAPYTDDQLQQLYDIYMQINFDDEHKAKLSQYLKDGIEEMRKLRDGDQQN